jgi:hypothetical protein
LQKKGANIWTGITNYCVNEAAATTAAAAAAALSPPLSLLKNNAITSSILHFKPRNAHQNTENLKWNGDTELKSQRNRRRPTQKRNQNATNTVAEASPPARSRERHSQARAREGRPNMDEKEDLRR